MRWFWSVLALVTCGTILWGCAAVFVIPTLDKDLSAEEAQWIMERNHARVPDSFDFVRMRRFGCPALAGGCGYEGSYTGPAERFSDALSVFTDPVRPKPPYTATCAELKKQRDGDAWRFDCSNAIEIQVNSPFGPSWQYLAVVRDPHSTTIYTYQREH